MISNCEETLARTNVPRPSPIADTSKISVTGAHGDESAAKFWGHLGLRLVGCAQSKWYPLSSEEADRIRSNLGRCKDVNEWLVVETLNNHTLAFRPLQLQRIWLLDDACDAPEGDFDREALWYDYEGLPAEIYFAIADWADGNCSGKSESKRAYTKAIQTAALSMIKQAGLTSRPDVVRSALRETKVHFRDGSTTQYEVDPENLIALAELDEESDTQIVEISSSENDFESFYPASALTMIDIPTIELTAARSEMCGR